MKKIVLLALAVLAGCATTAPPVNKVKMAEGYYMKGLSHFEQKNYELASVEFQRALQTDKNNKMANYVLGIISDMQGKPEEAIEFYEEAIDIDSDFSEAYNALGVVYSKQQKWKEARKAFMRALDNKLYTTPHLPYLNLGRMYMAQKEYDKAVDAYRESKRYATYDQTVFELGSALFEAGRVKEAIAEFQEGVSLAPKNAQIRYSLAVALLKDGNKKGAASEFKKAAELAPGTELAQKAQDYLKTLR
jgi:Tfp pilus assembly protein PilF